MSAALPDNEDGSVNANERRISKSHAHNYYISVPWSPQIYFTVRGAENFHIYLWIAKDFSWAQDQYYPSVIFGILALAWCGVLAYHALEAHNFEECYMLVALILWLFGNFWWMYGEVVNGDDDVNTVQGGNIMEAAIAWMLLYIVVLRPLGIIKPDESITCKYRESGLHSRFSYFQNWRQYEHAHTFFWLGKDLSWNTYNPYTWVIFMIPTLIIAVDFIWITWQSKKMMIDCAHYVAQLFWVLGNLFWAAGELFNPANDSAKFMFHMYSFVDREASTTGRWWAAWALLCAYVPIVLLYFVWLPLTCTGRIKAADIPENQEFGHEQHALSEEASGAVFSRMVDDEDSSNKNRKDIISPIVAAVNANDVIDCEQPSESAR